MSSSQYFIFTKCSSRLGKQLIENIFSLFGSFLIYKPNQVASKCRLNCQNILTRFRFHHPHLDFLCSATNPNVTFNTFQNNFSSSRFAGRRTNVTIPESVRDRRSVSRNQFLLLNKKPRFFFGLIGSTQYHRLFLTRFVLVELTNTFRKTKLVTPPTGSLQKQESYIKWTSFQEQV